MLIALQGQLAVALMAKNAQLAGRVAQLEAANADLAERLARLGRKPPRQLPRPEGKKRGERAHAAGTWSAHRTWESRHCIVSSIRSGHRDGDPVRRACRGVCLRPAARRRPAAGHCAGVRSSQLPRNH
jgi:hypothetical protein